MNVIRSVRSGAIALAVLAGGAAGQHGIPEAGPLYEPEFGRLMAPLFTQSLDLDEEQAAIVTAMLEDYAASFEAALGDLRTAERDLRSAAAVPVEPDLDLEMRVAALREELDRIVREAETIRDGPEADRARRELEARAGELREQIRAISADDGRGAYRGIEDEMARLLRGWLARREELGSGFRDDVSTVLRPEQLDGWHRLDRRLRRERSLPGGTLSGEKPDLVRLVERLEPDDDARERLAPVLATYEEEMDRALRARDGELAASAVGLFIATQEGDLDRRLALIERQQALRAGVRDVNVAFAGRLAAALGADDGSLFLDMFRRDGYPRVYGSTLAQRALLAAQEIPDLEPDVLGSVQALRNDLERELEAVNAGLVVVIDRHEPAEPARRLRELAAVRSGDAVRTADPIVEAFDRRRALGERYLASLRALLTAEQYERLPGIYGGR